MSTSWRSVQTSLTTFFNRWEEQEFAESKAAGNGGQNNYSRPSSAATDADGFMNIPDGIDDELPFS